MQVKTVGIVLVALLGAAVSSARAQGVPVQMLDLQDKHTTLRVAGELGFYTGLENPTVTQLQSLLYFGIAPSESFELTIEWAPGGTIFSERLAFLGVVGNKGRFTASNPTLTAFYRHRDRNLQLRVGAGMALPLTFVDETDSAAAVTEVISFAVRTATWGGWDMWMLAPDRLSFVLPLQLEARVVEYLALGMDTGVGFMIPLESAAEPIYELQMAVWPAVVLDPVMIGLRVQVVALFSPAVDAESNVALAPFIQADLGPGFIYARFLANVSDGLYGGSDLLWSATLGGGGDF